jgi:hypothetical protein
VKNATLKIYKGGSHSLGDTSKEQLNADLLAFLRGERGKTTEQYHDFLHSLVGCVAAGVGS